MPPETEGILVSGGSVATLTALAAAAHAKVDDRDQATGYVQEHTHAAVGKAWRILGFNPANLRVLKADPAHRLQPAAIDAAIHIDREAGLQPFLLVGTAGTTSTGSVDPLHDLADQARQEDLWFHVDGAYGAPARLTPRGEELLAGIERADSLVLDPHKWLFQPYEIGCVLVNHRRACSSRRSPSTARTCATPSSDHVQMRERGPQLTRRSHALKLWLSLTTFGLDAFREAIGHGIELAEHAEATLRTAGWEITSPASLGVVTFRRPGRRQRRHGAPHHREWLRGAEHDDPRRPHRGAAVHDQPPHDQARHRAHDRAPRKLREGRRTAGPPPCLWDRSYSHEAGLVRSEREVGRGRSFGGSVRGADRVRQEDRKQAEHSQRKVSRPALNASMLETGFTRVSYGRSRRASWRVGARR